ncbi:hypothetical protein BURPS406E_G0669 [Burkholderia pseudomallei 406e]|nr:hypothetical protein BURPS305_0852 [Burkholderia pseudomallei 305]EDO87513.1 hypothetical protein BURPS406E_G0669 [Burkholderia pseudomallei 406e]EDO93571.1 hypothetical protein BURPSPAST_J0863 [Burkholderia pseudomallei Pasteur 52237]
MEMRLRHDLKSLSDDIRMEKRVARTMRRKTNRCRPTCERDASPAGAAK